MPLLAHWCFSRPAGTVRIVLALIAVGVYFAAIDRVATVIAGAILPDRLQGMGIGILITAMSIGQFGVLDGDHDRRHAAGEGLGNLESFKVFKDGSPLESVDFSRWGVAFADDPNRFYATLRTSGQAHPVAGRRPIDDQPEWLNDTTLVYSDGLDIYTVAADGSGAPTRPQNASSAVSLQPRNGPAKKTWPQRPVEG